jgi:hypothetical protein
MPDLKTELKKLETLKFDDSGDTNVVTLSAAVALPDDQQISVSERCFNVIRDNPGCNRKRVLSLAGAAGISKTSAPSLISQFVSRGIVRIVDSSSGQTYFVVDQKYKPGYVKQNKKAKRVKKIAKVVEAAPKPTQPMASVPVSLDAFSAQDMIYNMSVGRAHALYIELKKLFQV